PVRQDGAGSALLFRRSRLGPVGLRGRLAPSVASRTVDAHRGGAAGGSALAARRDARRNGASRGAGARVARAAGAARSALSARAAGAERAWGAGAERSAVGAGVGRPRDLRRLLGAARAARRLVTGGDGAVVAAPALRSRAATSGLAGEDGAAVSAPVRDRLPRPADARAALPAVARAAANLSAAGSARRAAGREIRAGLLGRAVRAAAGGGCDAGGAEDSQGRGGAGVAQRVRPAEPGRHSYARGAGAGVSA